MLHLYALAVAASTAVLIFAGGLLLLWVSWKFWREIRAGGHQPDADGNGDAAVAPARSFVGAAWAVAVADVSMSLDNVLAVAGAAREHPGILVVGLLDLYRGSPTWFYAEPYGFLAAAYVILAFPYMYFSLDTGFRAIDVHTLTEASQSLGAGWPTTSSDSSTTSP